ncbi:MAG: ATP phosphoribosyltransferase regulatory subunit [Epsilonproteobacteria bacterium]|nr:ATP phosphoribosyltransferase regulatory subunit [Campylobacterota bacterium]
MIYEHEIPKDARLYFAYEAKRKRDIEKVASELLYKRGFEEIITPLFSYHQHKFVEDERELIRINDEKNRKLTLRADSTIDVVRLIINRLGRSTEHKRWFYIQPIYRYPSKEYYQIGAEILESRDCKEALNIVLEFFNKLNLKPQLQISNINIPKILSHTYNLDLETLKIIDVDKLLNTPHRWIERLLYLSKFEDIDELFGLVPDEIEEELVKMKELALSVNYENLIIAPLYYAKMRYYKDLFFRFFDNNITLATGGEYEVMGIDASGFAIYTDNVLEKLQKVENGG